MCVCAHVLFVCVCLSACCFFHDSDAAVQALAAEKAPDLDAEDVATASYDMYSKLVKLGHQLSDAELSVVSARSEVHHTSCNCTCALYTCESHVCTCTRAQHTHTHTLPVFLGCSRSHFRGAGGPLGSIG